MQFSFDFSDVSIDVNWKEIGKALLSFTGTGFLTIMAFGLVTLTGGTYPPPAQPTDVTVTSILYVSGVTVFLGAGVQLTVYGGWLLGNFVISRIQRLKMGNK